jgi:uncharacterized protein
MLRSIMLDVTTTALLAGVFFLGFAIESAVGFGSALTLVSLGAQLLPLSTLFPIFQPLSLGLSLIVCLRGRDHIDSHLLLREILPAMVPGVAVGMVLFRVFSNRATFLLIGVGAVIAALALFELQKTLRNLPPSSLPLSVRRSIFASAGVLHGLFGISGPPVVFAAGAQLSTNKQAFRATLSALWGILSLVLVVGYAVDGTMNASTLRITAIMLPALALGFVAGNTVHARVPQRTFRLLICVMLIASGTVLVVRTVASL